MTLVIGGDDCVFVKAVAVNHTDVNVGVGNINAVIARTVRHAVDDRHSVVADSIHAYLYVGNLGEIDNERHVIVGSQTGKRAGLVRGAKRLSALLIVNCCGRNKIKIVVSVIKRPDVSNYIITAAVDACINGYAGIGNRVVGLRILSYGKAVYAVAASRWCERHIFKFIAVCRHDLTADRYIGFCERVVIVASCQDLVAVAHHRRLDGECLLIAVKNV